MDTGVTSFYKDYDDYCQVLDIHIDLLQLSQPAFPAHRSQKHHPQVQFQRGLHIHNQDTTLQATRTNDDQSSSSPPHGAHRSNLVGFGIVSVIAISAGTFADRNATVSDRTAAVGTASGHPLMTKNGTGILGTAG
jgi:hypothetical protein